MIYAIADLHLSMSSDKPMDVFGEAWKNHEARLHEGFSVLSDEDVTVIPGDISWSMSLENALADFQFIDSLPGKKIIAKGNHDYWWETVSKTKRFFDSHGISTIDILHNNAFEYGDAALCGTRGWFYEEDTGNRRIYERELGRLERSLIAAAALEKSRILCFLHYPPVSAGYECDEITDMLEKYGVEACFYGHLHASGHRSAFQGMHKSVSYSLVSADYLDFKPIRIG